MSNLSWMGCLSQRSLYFTFSHPGRIINGQWLWYLWWWHGPKSNECPADWKHQSQSHIRGYCALDTVIFGESSFFSRSTPASGRDAGVATGASDALLIVTLGVIQEIRFLRFHSGILLNCWKREALGKTEFDTSRINAGTASSHLAWEQRWIVHKKSLSYIHSSGLHYFWGLVNSNQAPLQISQRKSKD